uniref:Secreted protein n=1 Tax=Achlya hypogyna TaxID=1202772 RepID=A0A0A7CMZ3_ACHHY|nr:secreted protein [Achlya hypogyna]
MEATLHALLLLMLALVNGAEACPTPCFCFGSTRVTVHCEFKNLSSVPMYIPVNTTHLCGACTHHGVYDIVFLHGNNFAVVTNDMFQGYAKDQIGNWIDTPIPLFQLTEIKLDLNPISIVNEFAFLPVPTLKLMSSHGRREHELIYRRYLPFFTQIQYQALSEMRLDKSTFNGFTRAPIHPLEDPTFIAFSRY